MQRANDLATVGWFDRHLSGTRHVRDLRCPRAAPRVIESSPRRRPARRPPDRPQRRRRHAAPERPVAARPSGDRRGRQGGPGLRRGQGRPRRRHARAHGCGRRADARRSDRAGPCRAGAAGVDAPSGADGALAPAPSARGRRRADPVPLRRLRRFLRALARSAPGLFVRVLPRFDDVHRSGAGGQARAHLHQAHAEGRRALPRHRRGLGRAAAVRRRELRRSRRRASP